MPITTSAGPLDLVFGLPLHPLVVHAVVVLLPLGALMVIALFVVKRWRGPMAWPTFGVLLVATAATFIARGSGAALQERVGDPGAHAEWGSRLPLAAVVLLVVAGAWLALARHRTSAATTILGLVAVVASIGALGLVAVTGHSGAEAAWKDVAAPAPASATEPAAGDGTPSTDPASPTSASTTAAASYTMAQVAEHATAQSCWAVIDGDVYDLTRWISAHPGGEQRILGLCGRDATADFSGKHGGEPGPTARRDSMRIGTLTD